jgi:hypothetical protein
MEGEGKGGVPEKRPVGALKVPGSKYDSTYANLAEKIVSRLGATDADLAFVLGVCVETIGNWKRQHPEFAMALRGKIVADAEVAHSLYRSAVGWSHEAVKIFLRPNGEIVEVPYVERFPPVVNAQMFWLRNRQRELWRDERFNRNTDVTFNLEALLQNPSAMDEALRQLAERGLVTDAMVEEVLARGPPELRGTAVEGDGGPADGTGDAGAPPGGEPR